MGFVHLHAHSTFSFLDGYGTPDQIRERIEFLGHKAVAITDHGSIFAHVPYAKVFKNSGIKPVFGVEAYICDDIAIRERSQASIGAEGIPHITILARNQKGYENLLALHRVSHEEGFYYKNRIDHRLLVKHQEGLIVLSGCPTGYPTRIIAGNKNVPGDSSAAYDHIRKLKEQIEYYFVEIVPQPGYEPAHIAGDVLVNIARELKIPVVLTADAHFPRMEDYTSQDLLLSIGLKRKFHDPNRMKLPWYQYYCGEEDMRQRSNHIFITTPQHEIDIAINNSELIANLCDVEIPKAQPLKYPGITLPETAETTLYNWVVRGMNEKYRSGLIPAEKWDVYSERALKEYEVIRRKGFCDYILVIADLAQWIKENDILMVCRGSGGGCLLLWLIGASITDPIKHDLSFERFYDDSRDDPPDADIDVEKYRRKECLDYLYSKYGETNCSEIASIIKIGAKQALRDTATAHNVPIVAYARLSALLNSKDDEVDEQIEDINDDVALEVLDEYPNLKGFTGIVGQYRQSSIHAAGVLISSEPLEKVVGVYYSRVKAGEDGRKLSTIDKKGASYLGLLKIDLLSVLMFDIIAYASKKVWGSAKAIETVPLDDPNVLQFASQIRFEGVFQLDGAAARRTSKDIQISDFSDLYAASALCRPGPMECIPAYRQNKSSPELLKKFLDNIHPIAAKIVKPTYGIIIYQEQVMSFAKELALMEWPEVHKLRSSISKSLGPAELNKLKERFVNGCISNNVSQSEAEYWWGNIEKHGSYSFNKSHGVTYAIVGYWCLYLKHYHPAEFYEAFVKLAIKQKEKKKIIKEFISSGGNVKIIDHEYSKKSHFIMNGNCLIGGFTGLRGIGDRKAEEIESKGPYETYQDLMKALPPTTVTSLSKVYSNESGWNPAELINLAPWMPIPATSFRHAKTKKDLYAKDIGNLPHSLVSGKTVTAGYVVDLEFTNNKIVLEVEDETGLLTARVSKAKLGSFGQQVKNVKIGDYVVVEGFWTGEILFLSSIRVVA